MGCGLGWVFGKKQLHVEDILRRNMDLPRFVTLCRASVLFGVPSSTTWSVEAGNDNVAARTRTQTPYRTTMAAK